MPIEYNFKTLNYLFIFELMSKSKTTRILPPGMEEEIVFGTMYVQIGTLKLIRQTNLQHQLTIQFWGEQSPTILETRSDLAHNSQRRKQQYQIHCPVTFFAEYLTDMSNNLKLEVQGIGKVQFDISKFLKKNVKIEDESAFDNFKGFFEIKGKNNRVMGSIEIQMGCTFEPSIAKKQLEQQQIIDRPRKQEEKKQLPFNRSEQDQVYKRALDVLAVENPNKLHEFHQEIMQAKNKGLNKNPKPTIVDPRIPNSLNTNPRNNSQFNPDKYFQQENEQIQFKGQTFKKIQDKEINKKKLNQPQSLENVINFPQVPSVKQILTYSNLGLNYQLDQKQQKPIDPKSLGEKQSIHQSVQEEQTPYQVPKQPIKAPIKNFSDQENLIQRIKDEPISQDSQLFNQFYGNHAGNPYIAKKNNEQKQPKLVPNSILQQKPSKFSPIKQPNIQQPKIPISPIVHKKQINLKDNQDRPLFNNPIIPSIQLNNNFNYGKPNSKKSSLLLNMLIKLHISKIQTKLKLPSYEIAYRSYGQKDRIKMGPQILQSQLQILSPISEQQLLKMAKVPFLIEIWNPNASTNKFIGIVKIPLDNIYRGFVLNGKPNEMAIKTNIVPTVIFDGNSKIYNLHDEHIGSIPVFASIGTPLQIDTFLNKPQQQRNQESHTRRSQQTGRFKNNEKQNEQQQKKNQEQKVPKKQSNEQFSLDLFDNFLAYIMKNNETVYSQISKAYEQNEKKENFFGDFLAKIQNNRFGPLVAIIKSPKQLEKVSNSFNDFQQFLLEVDFALQRQINKLKYMKSIDFNTLRKSIIECSSFNIISTSDLKLILEKNLETSSQSYSLSQTICQFLLYFVPSIENQHINIFYILHQIEKIKIKNRSDQQYTIQNYLCNNHLKLLYHTPFTQIFIKLFIKKCFEKESPSKVCEQVAKRFGRITKRIQIQQIGKFFVDLGINLSIWLCINIMRIAKQHFKQDTADILTIQYIAFYNWLLIQAKKFIQQQSMGVSESHQKINNQEQQKSISNNEIQPEKQNSQRNSNVNTQKNGSKKQDIKQQQQASLQQPEKTWTFTFSIEPFELILIEPVSGKCTLQYVFPLQSQHIVSKSFETFADKHKYQIKMVGKHSFTIKQKVSTYLADNPIKFLLKNEGKIIMEGAMHPDQLIQADLLPEVKNRQNKIIPLYGNSIETMSAKLKIIRSFQYAQAKDAVLMKQTTYNVFLPKKGYINFQIFCEAEFVKLRKQLNLKQDFYLALSINLFHQSQQLQSYFPLNTSKLYAQNNLENNRFMQLKGFYKINLNPVILEYIKNKTCRIFLNAIFYSKITGNYQRKELSVGTVNIPLIDIIKQGIQGKYAFKNKLGMFVALTQCEISLNKDILHFPTVQTNDYLKSTQKYWVLLHFLQFINFQQQSYTAVKCQFVFQGKRYSTQKIVLHGQTYFDMGNNSILMHLSRQEFQDLKILPLSVILTTGYGASHQKLAIDIDINSFSKNLGKNRLNVTNQYFMMIDQTSHSKQMRMGIKTYIFRGGYAVGNLVDAINRNLSGTNVFSQMDMPRQIEQYDKMVGILKKNLRITSKIMQQAQSQLFQNKSQKFPLQFFTTVPCFKLDYTPIIGKRDMDIEKMCEQLPSQIDIDTLMRYVKDQGIELKNYRKQIIERYSFWNLNKVKIDKNVEYLGLRTQIDLIVFVRKLKIMENEHQVTEIQNEELSRDVKDLTISILKGSKLHLLYNGIKPNVFLYLPQFNFRTQTQIRTSDPTYDEQYVKETLNISELRKIKSLLVEVYHESANQQILIGSGAIQFSIRELLQKLTIVKIKQKAAEMILRVTIDSAMSSKMQAFVDIRIELQDYTGIQNQKHDRISREQYEDSQLSEIDQSKDISRMGNIIKSYKKELEAKERLFQSSDDDDY